MLYFFRVFAKPEEVSLLAHPFDLVVLGALAVDQILFSFIRLAAEAVITGILTLVDVAVVHGFLEHVLHCFGVPGLCSAYEVVVADVQLLPQATKILDYPVS